MKLSLISASSLFLIASAAVVAPLSAGCAADEDTDESGEDLSGTTFDVKMPAGSAYAATITTNGSAACPRGDTLSASLAADGSSLKLVFASYAASLAKNQPSKSVDCALQVALKSRSSEQVAVSSVAFTGYSTLDKSGMLETHTASYSFAGAAASNEELDVKGPANGAYSFNDTIADARKAWSACGTSSTLSTSVKMNLANNPAKTGTGSLDPASRGVHHTLTIGLAHQSCTPVPTDDAGTVDPGDAGTDPGRDGGGIDPTPRDAGSVVLPDFDGGVLPIGLDSGIIPTPRGGR